MEKGVSFTLNENYRIVDIVNNLGFNAEKDIVLFPRNIVDVERLNYGNNESESFFVKKRTRLKSTRLDTKTPISKRALNSGLRSIIIKDENGKYLKLKGVAQHLDKYKSIIPNNELMYGLGKPNISIQEIVLAAITGRSAPSIVPLKANYIEAVPRLNWSDLEDLQVFNEGLIKPLKENLDKPELVRNYFAKRFGVSIDSVTRFQSNISAVTAFEIPGDTRLDEAIYHLTKNQLKGIAKGIRNKLLLYISKISGEVFASLHFTRSSSHGSPNNTNSHIGNIVLYDKDNYLSAGIVDIGNLSFEKTESSFQEPNLSEIKQFAESAHAEMMLYKDDFFHHCTYSTPVALTYQYFPDSVRQDCFNAFRWGYENRIADLLSKGYDKDKLLFNMFQSDNNRNKTHKPKISPEMDLTTEAFMGLSYYITDLPNDKSFDLDFISQRMDKPKPLFRSEPIRKIYK